MRATINVPDAYSLVLTYNIEDQVWEAATLECAKSVIGTGDTPTDASRDLCAALSDAEDVLGDAMPKGRYRSLGEFMDAIRGMTKGRKPMTDVEMIESARSSAECARVRLTELFEERSDSSVSDLFHVVNPLLTAVELLIAALRAKGVEVE